MDECVLEVTQHEVDEIVHNESVVIREYERSDGSRYAKAVAWGDHDEMIDQASIKGMFIIPVGIKIVCQRAFKVSDIFETERRGDE